MSAILKRQQQQPEKEECKLRTIPFVNNQHQLHNPRFGHSPEMKKELNDIFYYLYRGDLRVKFSRSFRQSQQQQQPRSPPVSYLVISRPTRSGPIVLLFERPRLLLPHVICTRIWQPSTGIKVQYIVTPLIKTALVVIITAQIIIIIIKPPDPQ